MSFTGNVKLFFQIEDPTLKRHKSIGVFVVYIGTGSPILKIPSKPRDRADENNKILTQGKLFETTVLFSSIQSFLSFGYMYFRVDMHSHLCFVIQYHNSFPFFPAMKIVAFSAKLTTDVNLGQDQTVAYNNVITNVGGAYDPNTGYFTSLVKGVYIFSASIFTLFVCY